MMELVFSSRLRKHVNKKQNVINVTQKFNGNLVRHMDLQHLKCNKARDEHPVGLL